MAGHSKWANIKHRKAAVDARRGKLFTKVSKEIIVAARLGGGDPEGNSRLRMAIQNARAVSMPVDNIKRAIQRGTGEIEGVTYEDVTYEGYAAGGVAVMVECTTENRNRTVQEVRATFSKYGGNLGETNSVLWNFNRMGEIVLNSSLPEDTLFEIAVDSGCSDVDILFDEGAVAGAVLHCPVDSLQSVTEALEKAGLEVSEQHLAYVPNTKATVTDPDTIKKIIKLLDVFEDNDDVQQVFHNADLPDDAE
ncbi:MAG: YebC/PmpR family DNA-binding transcriptional regulator [Chlorobi bacterium]|nr:MAG: YebC/PmpR family DNA-binding transcriptional regulator [Bacteroidota bacterium]KXK36202.1 MAG: Transcriptional regulator [Chlorobi bacterium OLB6]MBL1161933.1 YebC/PmpR family DNA-binding transcriptional regulator [Chlorobiota bacterium]MBW7854445.1 YebC/PmpR family DNA-binding transcriptional regulator [Candidatus Kapabacteria bacterium]MCC6331994.1 YebC/PmpR family DNA-binding transcriptional regulator [Ignavibacteria bacterium]